MSGEKNSLAVLALSLTTAGCVGFKQYSQLSYSHQIDAKAANSEDNTSWNDKKGFELTHGVGSKLGDHRLSTGFHFKNLPDTSSSQKIIINPEDYRQHGIDPDEYYAQDGIIREKYLFDEEMVATITGRNSLDIFTSLERIMFNVSPASWFSFSGLLGAGINFNLVTGKETYTIADNELMKLPHLKLDSVKGFGGWSAELKFGQSPYPIIPLQIGTRVYHDGSAVHIFKIGYEVQWGSGD